MKPCIIREPSKRFEENDIISAVINEYVKNQPVKDSIFYLPNDSVFIFKTQEGKYLEADSDDYAITKITEEDYNSIIATDDEGRPYENIVERDFIPSFAYDIDDKFFEVFGLDKKDKDFFDFDSWKKDNLKNSISTTDKTLTEIINHTTLDTDNIDHVISMISSMPELAAEIINSSLPNREIAQVKADNGQESRLFNDLSKLYGNKEAALNVWARTYTNEFQRWFEGSKVVDENGEPKLMFSDNKTSREGDTLVFNTDNRGQAVFLNIKEPGVDGTIEGNVMTVNNSDQVTTAEFQKLMSDEDGFLDMDIDDDTASNIVEAVMTDFSKLLAFKKQQLREIDNRLGQIKRLRKAAEKMPENSTQEIKDKKDTIKGLVSMQVGLERRKGWVSEKGGTGLLNEIGKLESQAGINSIKFIADRDFERLNVLINSEELSDIKEAQEIIEFYSRMNIVHPDKPHPLFTKDELFHPNNVRKITDEALEYYDSLANQAREMKAKLDTKKKEVLTKIINETSNVQDVFGQQLSYDEIIHKKEGLKDTHWLDMWLMDITMGTFSKNGILPQAAFSVMQDLIHEETAKANELQEKLDRLQPQVENELRKDPSNLLGKFFSKLPGVSFDIFQQISPDTGMLTGKIINRFSSRFFSSRNTMNKKFTRALNYALKNEDQEARKNAINRVFEARRKWYRENTIQLNLTMIPEIQDVFTLSDFGVAFDSANSDAHVKELKELLGEDGYKEEVDKQIKQLRKYQNDYEAYAAILDDDKLEHWVKENSPFSGNDYQFKTADITHKNMTVRPNMKYNISIPRKFRGKFKETTADGRHIMENSDEDLMNYDENFEKIENNDVLYDYWKTLREVHKYAEGGLSVDTVANMENNSAPAIDQSVTEMLFNMAGDNRWNKFRAMVGLGWQKFKDIISARLQDYVSHAQRDELTGKLKYKMNDSFFTENKQRINSMIKVEQAKIAGILGVKVNKLDDIIFVKENPEIKRRVGIWRNIIRIETAKLNNPNTSAQDKAIAKRKLAKYKAKLNDIVVTSTLGKNSELLDLIASYFDVPPTIDAIESRLSGTSDLTMNELIKQTVHHRVAQQKSFDLPRIYKMYLSMASEHIAKQNALPIIDFMEEHYNQIKTTGRSDEKLSIIEEGRENAARQFDYWKKRVVMQHYGDEPGKAFVKSTKLEKYLDKIGKHINDMTVKEKAKYYLLNMSEIARAKFPKNYTKDEKIMRAEINTLLKNPDLEEEMQKSLKIIRDNLGRDYTAPKLVEGLMVWTRLLGLGYKISSSLTNLMEGTASNLVLTAMGDHFSEDTYWRANKIAKSSFWKNLKGGLSYVGINLKPSDNAIKMRTLMDKTNVLQDSKNELQKSSVKTTYSKLASALSPYELNARTEYLIQSPVMIAIFMETPIADVNGNTQSASGEKFNVWDALNSDGTLKAPFRTKENIQNWEKMNGAEYSKAYKKIETAINQAHGNYSTLRGMLAKKGVAGKAMLMFKTWLPNNLYSRFAVEQDNILAKQKGFKGRYRSFTMASANITGAMVGFATIGGLPGVLGGTLLVGGATRHIGKKDNTVVASELNWLEDLAFSTRMILMKAIGMPMQRIAGKEIPFKFLENIDEKLKNKSAFYEKYMTGDYTKLVKMMNEDDDTMFSMRDARNLNANMTEMALLLQKFILMMMVKGLFWDDEDESDDPNRIVHNILMNKLNQLSDAITGYLGNVYSVVDNFTDFAVINTLGQVKKTAQAIKDTMRGEPYVKRGLSRGDNAILHEAQQLIPGVHNTNYFGFQTDAEKQHRASPFDYMFKSDLTKKRAIISNKRIAFKVELERRGLPDKVIRKLVNARFPLPKKPPKPPR